MDLQKAKSSKRLDLQGIRGLAIIVVLGFHFFPEYFPNGYLGVDQFFVLSGFLMCMLLKRAENQSTCSLISLFYSKRFKRILPLYLLVILFSMISLYSFFPDTAIETNQESAIHALLFVSNRPKTDQENYFQMLSIAVDIFTHTWSLSVEIQFYFLVPFIFLLSTKVPEKFKYFYYGIIGFISFIFFGFSSPTVAFNSVFARIWQFLIGMVVYLLGNLVVTRPEYQKLKMEDTDLEEGEKEEEPLEEITYRRINFSILSSIFTSYTVLLILISITSFPFSLSDTTVRPLVTIGTGYLMLISHGNRFLSNRILTYIGDISYSLYLIHWPIYAYWKLTCDGDKYLLVCALAASVILAVITYETYEKWYLKLSSTNIGLLVVMLFFVNIVVINQEEIMDQFNSIGRNFSSLDEITDNMTGLKRTGKYKFAIIGNSFVANHAKLFYQECAYKAKSIIQGSAFGCEPFYPSTGSEMCKSNLTDFEERIRKEKPDYTFIFTRYISIGEPFPKNVTSFEKDPIYQIMKKQMLKLIENIKYKLYILDSIPRINYSRIKDIASLVKKKTDFLAIDKMLIQPHQYEMARKRNGQLVKDCKGKCEMVDYLPEFYNNATKTFRYFDERGFSYWTTPNHLTPRALERVRHLWTDICTKI